MPDAISRPSPSPSRPSTFPIPTQLTPSAFHLIAGLGSGFTSAVLLQPADLLKTRVQQETRSASPRPLLTTLRSIASSPHPIRQLWRGTLASAIRTSVGSALYFTSLNSIRTHLAPASAPNTSSSSSSSSLPRLPPLANLASGAVARASVGFVMMPITVLKVRFESSLYAYSSLRAAARALWAEGARGLFAGFGATALRDAPYAGLYVLFYEWNKRIGAEALGGRTPGTVVNFVSGATAASVATALTNPPDAVKTRLQLQPGKYRNTMQAARLMIKEDGVRSLFDGLGLRMARKALSSALAWTVYEEVIRQAQNRWTV